MCPWRTRDPTNVLPTILSPVSWKLNLLARSSLWVVSIWQDTGGSGRKSPPGLAHAALAKESPTGFSILVLFIDFFLMLKLLTFLCMGICLHVYQCTRYIPGAHKGQKRHSYSLEVEIQVAVSFNANARNRIPILWKIIYLCPSVCYRVVLYLFLL